MKTQQKSTGAGITVRFPAPIRERVTRLARSEHCSAAAYIEKLVERDLRARDEAERIVRVYVAPGAPEPTGAILRGEDETAEDHANRSEVLNKLFGVR